MNLIQSLTQKECERQRTTLNLIASENYPSPKTLEALGSVWMNKYAEGYPKKRYYAGNVYADELEEFVQNLALKVYDKHQGYGVNLQVLSGSQANSIVYLSCLEYGDSILSLNLANGGHLSHLHQTSSWKKFFHHYSYDLISIDGEYRIDENDYEYQLQKYRPKLTIIGFSSYTKKYEFEKLCKIAHRYGSLVLADIAHISGLVASSLHSSPFGIGEEGADFVTMTTHKTLRGPRGAMVFAKNNYMPLLNKTVFPGTSGGPHLNKIASIGQALLEIVGEDVYPDLVAFDDYSKRIIETCKALEEGIMQGGCEISMPTQNHICLAKLPEDVDSVVIQNKLENLGIITNRNLIPFDTKTAWRPSGLRLGTAPLASRGITIEQSKELGKLISRICLGQITDSQAKRSVESIVQELNWWY